MSKADAAVDALMGKAALDSRVFGFSARSAIGRAKHMTPEILGLTLRWPWKMTCYEDPYKVFFVDLLDIVLKHSDQIPPGLKVQWTHPRRPVRQEEVDFRSVRLSTSQAEELKG